MRILAFHRAENISYSAVKRQVEYEVVWDGAHHHQDADLLRPLLARPRPHDPIDERHQRQREDPRSIYDAEHPRERWCLECGQQFFARSPSDARRRRPKFCSSTCSGLYRRALIQTAHHVRRRTQHKYPLQPCEVCGATVRVERHHRDNNPFNDGPANIGFLCRFHHLLHHKLERQQLRHARMQQRQA